MLRLARLLRLSTDYFIAGREAARWPGEGGGRRAAGGGREAGGRGTVHLYSLRQSTWGCPENCPGQFYLSAPQ